MIVMDGDLQDPPEVLPDLIDKWREGYEVVYAVRRRRKEGVFKRAAYWVFYRVLGCLGDVRIPLDSGDFGLMDRRVVDLLKKMPERNRFVRGIRSWAGFRQTPLEYDRAGRAAGKTKYTFLKLLRLAADGVFSFSYAPLRLATVVGIVMSGLSLLYAAKVFIWWAWELDPRTPRGWTTTVIAVLFLGGVQLMTTGVLGEYVGRIHEEVKQRPLYVLKETIGFRDSEMSQKG